MNIKYSRCDSREELLQILQLQQENLAGNLSSVEKSKEGFTTVMHSEDLLNEMNKACAHILAKDGARVAGYALCMHPDFAQDIEVLRPMFDKIEEQLHSCGNFMVMGQICIDRPYRKKGIFRGLYDHMRAALLPEYGMIVTEVDAENGRSLQAHHAIGFVDQLVYSSGGRNWHLIKWEI